MNTNYVNSPLGNTKFSTNSEVSTLNKYRNSDIAGFAKKYKACRQHSCTRFKFRFGSIFIFLYSLILTVLSENEIIT